MDASSIQTIQSSCNLTDLLEIYKEEALLEKVVLDSSEGCESIDLSIFQSHYLEASLIGASESTVGRKEDEHTLKRQKSEFKIQHGDGADWSEGNAVALQKPTPQSSDAEGIERPRNRRGKGASSRHKRKGLAIKEAGGDEIVAQEKRLLLSWLRKGLTYTSLKFSLVTNVSVTASGWNGLQHRQDAKGPIRDAYLNGSIKEIIRHFFPIQCWDLSKPAVICDSSGRIIAYRTSQGTFLAAKQTEVADAIDKLVGPLLHSANIQEKSAQGERGAHLLCIIGHHRPYKSEPCLTSWHKHNQDLVREFITNPIIVSITNWVCSVVRLVFPGVAERVTRCAQWHKETYNIEPICGLFWNLCVNGIFPDQKRIHCLPHADSKNIVGICVVVVYELPGKKFNHSQRSWLVLWEAGVVIQLPPWVMLCFPSSLFLHFNIDISDIKFVVTEGNEPPTPENSMPLGEGDDEGRGSLVYFNQATLFQSSETNNSTISNAIKKGHSGKINFEESVQSLFQKHSTFVPM